MARKTTSKRFSTVPPTAAPVKEAAKAAVKVAAPIVSAEVPAAVVAKVAETSTKPTAAVIAPVAVPAVSIVADITGMIAALHDSDADTAREGAVSLGKSGNKAAVEPLIEALSNKDGYFHGVVRAAAASSLAELGDVRAFDTLVNAMNDPMAETSAEAIRALATLGDSRAVQPLIEAVRNSDGFFLPVVRRAAVIALVKLGGEQATAELKSVAACTWEDSVIRQEAGHVVSDAE